MNDRDINVDHLPRFTRETLQPYEDYMESLPVVEIAEIEIRRFFHQEGIWQHSPTIILNTLYVAGVLEVGEDKFLIADHCCAKGEEKRHLIVGETGFPEYPLTGSQSIDSYRQLEEIS